MERNQFIIAVILTSILIILLITFLVLGFICYFKAIKEKNNRLSEDELFEKLEDLKKQTEANEYFKVNGVISKEDYEKEKSRIINEVEELSEVINGK